MKCIKGSAVIAVLTMTVVLGGCTNSEAGNASSEPVTEPHRVIIDSDTGADATACVKSTSYNMYGKEMSGRR